MSYNTLSYWHHILVNRAIGNDIVLMSRSPRCIKIAHLVATVDGVDQDKEIAIEVWHAVSGATPSGTKRRSWSPALVGVLGTIVLHALLVPGLGISIGILGQAQTHRLPKWGPGATLASESLVLLPVISVSRSAELAVDPGTAIRVIDANVAKGLQLPAEVAIERLALDDAPSPASIAPLDPDLERANEIYNRQILARIVRVWQQPTTTIGESGDAATSEGGAFRCQAQLEQDDHGNVREVLLPACNGSEAWRRSPLVAIRQASPLPAPPDPRVFRASLVLHFSGGPLAEALR